MEFELHFMFRMPKRISIMNIFFGKLTEYFIGIVGIMNHSVLNKVMYFLDLIPAQKCIYPFKNTSPSLWLTFFPICSLDLYHSVNANHIKKVHVSLA